MLVLDSRPKNYPKRLPKLFFFQSSVQRVQRLYGVNLLNLALPKGLNSPKPQRNVPMIQCLAEKRADVNYRITVTRPLDSEGGSLKVQDREEIVRGTLQGGAP